MSRAVALSRQQVLPPLVAADGATPLRAALSSAHRAGDYTAPSLIGWQPYGGSADGDLLYDLPLITARTRDIARNDGYASGAMQSHLDSVIGAALRLAAKPDWRVLGLSPEWASAWGRDVEARFRLWGSDSRKFCDAARGQTFGGLVGMAYRSLLMNGAALAAMLWLDRGPSIFRTAVQLIEPDRLGNPGGAPDSEFLRGGVALDQYGAQIGYHVRKRHPGDALLSFGAGDFETEFVPRETVWGRPSMIHAYDPERIGQNRGKSIFAPALEVLKQLSRFRSSELDSALLNSIFAATVESPFDPTFLGEAEDVNTEAWNGYQSSRMDNARTQPIKLSGGGKIPRLFPGEVLKFHTAGRAAAAFEAFEAATLRHVAAATGLTYEQISRDWSKVNYSSARGAMLQAWQGFYARRERFGTDFATQIYVCWLEEAIDRGDVKLPPGAPSFHAALPAYTACRWIGPAMPMIDALKEADAIGRRLELGITTLEHESAAQGRDWEDDMEQQAREMAKRRELGLPEPGAVPMARQYPSDPAPPAAAQGNQQ